jgi:hypothetical protein
LPALLNKATILGKFPDSLTNIGCFVRFLTKKAVFAKSYFKNLP